MYVACFCGNVFDGLDSILFCSTCGLPTPMDPHTEKLYEQMQAEKEALIRRTEGGGDMTFPPGTK